MPKAAKSFAITAAQRNELRRWRRRQTTPHSLALRAHLILLLADGVAPVEIIERLDVTRPTVFKWRKRFEQDGLDGLRDKPRPGQPRKLTQKQIERVLRLTVERIPHEATHWSTRLMAKYAGVTQYQVREIWKAADLKPHRLKTFKIINDLERVGDLAVNLAIRRESHRRRRAVPGSARQRHGAIGRREDPDPGAGPHPADVAVASRPDRAAHA